MVAFHHFPAGSVENEGNLKDDSQSSERYSNPGLLKPEAELPTTRSRQHISLIKQEFMAELFHCICFV
jgi:hypothetical protein